MSNKSITLLELHLHDGFDFTATAENTAPAIGSLGDLFGSDDTDDDAAVDGAGDTDDAADDGEEALDTDDAADDGEGTLAAGDAATDGEEALDDAADDTAVSGADAPSGDDDDSVVSSGPVLAAALLLLALVAAVALAYSKQGDDGTERADVDDEE
jgi:hypothetical protein